jgi:hypothetical protein
MGLLKFCEKKFFWLHPKFENAKCRTTRTFMSLKMGCEETFKFGKSLDCWNQVWKKFGLLETDFGMCKGTQHIKAIFNFLFKNPRPPRASENFHKNFAFAENF